MKLYLQKAFALVLSLAILCSVTPGSQATTAEEIQKEIEQLEEEASELSEQRDTLEQEMLATEEETRSFAEEKLRIDREIALYTQEIQNLNEQIHHYNTLIAEKQAELDELERSQQELYDRYRLRMRSLQERSQVTIWTVLLSADSFAELLRDRVMIEEIAYADQRMFEALRLKSEEIIGAKEALAAQKLSLERKKEALLSLEDALAQKRAEADAMIAELSKNREALRDEIAALEAMEAALHEQIAEMEKEYTEQLQQSGDPLPPTEDQFIFPCDASGFVCITDSYGMRYHPLDGQYKMHNGVDFACYWGTAIYASKSGIVTTASSHVAWGEHIVINHGDGFSTLYAHMSSYTVAEGDYVSRGQVIGYVGSSGYSTGPHLHFTIYYNGGTVNPMSYVSLP